MPPKLEAAWRGELLSGEGAEAHDNLEAAWRHLERAHVLSQAYALAHVVVHARMLAFALRRGDRRELRGQLIRVLLAAPASWFGRAPLGNTGGSNVGMFEPMGIPEELRAMLEARPHHLRGARRATEKDAPEPNKGLVVEHVHDRRLTM